MGKSFLIYDEDGKIECKYMCHESVIEERVEQMFPGMRFIEGKGDDSSHYVSAGVIVPRPTMPASIDKAQIQANAQEIAVISGPEGAAVAVSGPVSASETMDADGIAFTTDVPGVYTVRMILFPYLDWEATIEAT